MLVCSFLSNAKSMKQWSKDALSNTKLYVYLMLEMSASHPHFLVGSTFSCSDNGGAGSLRPGKRGIREFCCVR